MDHASDVATYDHAFADNSMTFGLSTMVDRLGPSGRSTARNSGDNDFMEKVRSCQKNQYVPSVWPYLRTLLRRRYALHRFFNCGVNR
jgi:hypothetical protein